MTAEFVGSAGTSLGTFPTEVVLWVKMETRQVETVKFKGSS